jgi:hypothetical protein
MIRCRRGTQYISDADDTGRQWPNRSDVPTGRETVRGLKNNRCGRATEARKDVASTRMLRSAGHSQTVKRSQSPVPLSVGANVSSAQRISQGDQRRSSSDSLDAVFTKRPGVGSCRSRCIEVRLERKCHAAIHDKRDRDGFGGTRAGLQRLDHGNRYACRKIKKPTCIGSVSTATP